MLVIQSLGLIKMTRYFIILFIYSLCSISLFGQSDSLLILNTFDSVNYSPNGKTSAYQIKEELLHGSYLEFDSTGAPILIGKYKKGLKVDTWLCSDGSYLETKNGKLANNGFIPGCGTSALSTPNCRVILDIF